MISGIGTDWTTQGVRTLSLRFQGVATNDIEPMWVQLNNGAKVTYGDFADEDPAAIQEESWHEWLIDMADFGVGLGNVVSISIGFGTEGSATPGGSGTLYFDDIRLYTPKCFPARHSGALAKADFAPVGQDKRNIRYDSDGGEGNLNLIKYGVTTGDNDREEDESLSDVQIHNYPLSQTEINTVKNGGAIPPKDVHYPIPSAADVHQDDPGSGVINFKDYSELLDSWLIEVKYPQ